MSSWWMAAGSPPEGAKPSFYFEEEKNGDPALRGVAGPPYDLKSKEINISLPMRIP
jgi:hypothetical protein